MKKTWRFRSLPGDAAKVMASASSLATAAKALGVDKSTVFRWVKTGKLPAPGGRRRSSATTAAPAGLSAKAWRARVRRTYALDVNETVLVDMAAAALDIAQDPKARAETRLAAMRTFAALRRQLDFEGAHEDETKEPEATTPVRSPWPRVAG